jgi:hypothetical protein
MKINHLSCLVLALAGVVSPGEAAEEPVSPRLVEEIRQEATRANQGEGGRPLPLAGHWNMTGMGREGFTPAYQLQLLHKGHHILPWLDWPPTDRGLDSLFKKGDPRRQKYIDDRLKEYEPVVKELARLRLPISFLATQWESVLTYDRDFFGLPAEQNPNVIGTDGKVQGRVCPFGPIEPWRKAGRSWTDNFFLQRIKEWYPNPPLVLLISNNEHAKLPWTEVEQSQRYLDRYGRGRPAEFKRRVVGDGWIERYRALLESMRAGLASEHWRKHVKFVGYEAFPPVHFGRWGGWKEYSLTIPNRLDPQPVVWDGGSPSYYLHNWMALTDYTLWSPQVETMNWVFMLGEIHRTRPDFWFEMSTWDGNVPGQANDKRMFYARQGQLFTPARYQGFVQFGMWLMRPRLVREFRGHTETVEYAGPYFDPILEAVDRVYRDPVLEKFWRKGTLAVNPRGKHPFQADIPPEYSDRARWFLLDTSLTPRELRPEEFDNASPPSRQTELPVFALALVLGSAPEREWLVYAHAPRQARVGVAITIPDLGPITIDVPQSGSFFHVQEKGKQVKALLRGGPASFRLEAPTFTAVGTPATFAVSEKYSPADPIDRVVWDFGDRTSAKGDRFRHRFEAPGQYLVSVTGFSKGSEVVRQEVPVFVGLEPEKDLVCRLLMKGALRQGMKSWIWLSGWDKAEYHLIPDASGRGNVGFQAGGAWVKDEQRGTVLELNGVRDRVEITNSPDINTGSVYRQRSVAFWFRPGVTPKARRQVLYEEGGSGAGLNLYLDGGTLHAGVWNAGKKSWLQARDLDRKAWHHVALVLRTENAEEREAMLELYLDGKKVAQEKAPVLGAHPGDINLGRSGNTLFHDGTAEQPGAYFAGRLDDFRITNWALTPEEVGALARAGG